MRVFSEDWLTENIYHANAKIHAKLMKIALTLCRKGINKCRKGILEAQIGHVSTEDNHEATKAGKSNVIVYRRRFVGA